MKPKYDTLQSIVDQLEFCEFVTPNELHALKDNAVFIALKEKALLEAMNKKDGRE